MSLNDLTWITFLVLVVFSVWAITICIRENGKKIDFRSGLGFSMSIFVAIASSASVFISSGAVCDLTNLEGIRTQISERADKLMREMPPAIAPATETISVPPSSKARVEY